MAWRANTSLGVAELRGARDELAIALGPEYCRALVSQVLSSETLFFAGRAQSIVGAYCAAVHTQFHALFPSIKFRTSTGILINQP